jgi:hypothetical protein
MACGNCGPRSGGWRETVQRWLIDLGDVVNPLACGGNSVCAALSDLSANPPAL